MAAERASPRRPAQCALARTLAVVGAAASLAACGEPTAPRDQPAYDPTQLTGGLVYHWDLGRAIDVYVDPTGEQAGESLEAAVTEAARLWTAVVNYREFAVKVVDSPAAADVVFHYRGTPRLVDTRGCEAPGSEFAEGYTLFCPVTPVAPVLPLLAGDVEGRVKVDVFVEATPSGGATLEALVTHELGHVLGIGAHSADAADVMNPFPHVAAPSERDARTLRYVLHEPADIRL